MVNNEQLSGLEIDIFDKISKNNVGALKMLLAQLETTVDFVDENGMTPLQHACYKMNKEAVQCLLDQGADVNFNRHATNYSALHFGALSGSKEICLMLLLAGADAHALNSVSRTPPQMAAFVGNHGAVATINNFIPKSEIEYYTIIQGQQTEPYLPVLLLESFHNFVIQSNIHPVRIALNLQKVGSFNDHLKQIRKVLEMMVEREMQRRNDINEIMAFKYHYLGWIVNEIIKCRDYFQSRKDNGSDTKTDYCELFAKRVLKENKSGLLDYLESSIRDCVREFPFRECTIFRQVVSQLANKDSAPALDVVRSAINGQRGFTDEITYCSTCGEEKPDKKCSKCKEVQYCDRECQRLHWFMHKKTCARPISSTTTASGVGVAGNVTPSGQTKPDIDANEISEQFQNLVGG